MKFPLMFLLPSKLSSKHCVVLRARWACIFQENKTRSEIVDHGQPFSRPVFSFPCKSSSHKPTAGTAKSPLSCALVQHRVLEAS